MMDQVRETHQTIDITQWSSTTVARCDCGWIGAFEGVDKAAMALARRAWNDHKCRAS